MTSLLDLCAPINLMACGAGNEQTPPCTGFLAHTRDAIAKLERVARGERTFDGGVVASPGIQSEGRRGGERGGQSTESPPSATLIKVESRM